MASTASLQTKRRYAPVAHYTLWMIRRYGWLIIPPLAVYSFLTFVISSSTQYAGGSRHFALMESGSRVPLRWSVVLFGLFTAFVLFGYLWNRRESNCYGAIGISRSKQFLIRYWLGFAMNVLPIVLSLVAAYRLGLRRIDADPHGVCGHYTLVFILALCLVSWLSYTVSVIVAVLCGRFVSAGLCAAGVLAAPYAVMFTAQCLMNAFLLGAPGGSMFIPYDKPWLNYMENIGKKPGLFTMLEDCLGDALFFEDSLMNAVYAERYLQDHALPTVKFLLLGGAALALCSLAWWLFCRRKTERAGQLFVNPVLGYLTALTAGIAAGALLMCISLPVERTAALWLKGLTFLGTMVIVTLLVRLMLTREWRSLARSLPVAGGAAAVVSAVILCLVTGGFGYASYIPEANEIASVQVTYNQNKTPYIDCRAGSSGSMWQGSNEIDGVELIYYEHYYSAFEIPWKQSPCLTSPEDIETVRRIHKAIIEDGLRPNTGREAAEYADSAVTVHYCISYTLKSGKVINRYYENLSLGTLEATLEIDNTSTLREKMQTLHANGFSAPEQKAVLCDPMFAASAILDLSYEEKAALFAAIDADYADLTVAQRYFPAAGDVLGIIYLSHIYESEIGGASVEVETVAARVDLDSDLYYITPAYTRTLAFLEAHDLTKHMSASYTVTAVLVQDYTPRHHADSAMTYQFRSVPNLNQLDGKHVAGVTRLPEDEWDATIAASVPTAMLTRPGRMIFIIMENAEGQEMAVTRFVPD